jgi:hypothetical protein
MVEQTGNKMTLSSKEWRDVKNDIKNGKALLDRKQPGMDHAFRKEMAMYRRWYRGFFKPEEVQYDKIVADNDFWNNVQVYLPNLYFKMPYISAIPKREQFEFEGMMGRKVVKGEDGAMMLEGIHNHYSEILNDAEVFTACITDSLICSYAAHFTDWITEEDISLKPDWESDETAEQKINRVGTERTMALKVENKEPIEGEQLEDIPATKQDNLVSWRISPFDILFDPECTDSELKTARFIGIRYVLPTKYVKKLFNLPELKGSNIAVWSDHEDDVNQDAPELTLERNEVIQYWDIENERRVYYVDTKEDGPAKVENWDTAMKGFPVTLLVFNEDNDRMLPIPDFRQIKHLVFEKIRLYSKMSELLDRLRRTYLADDSIAKALDDILNGGEANVVSVKNPHGRPLESFIAEVADFTITQSYTAYLEVINGAIERGSGLSDYQRGLVSEVKRTATEMIQLSGAQNLRIEKRRDVVVKFIVKVIKKRTQLLQENAVLQDVVRITKNNITTWPTWDRESIQGEYDFTFDVSTMIKKNKEVERKQAGEKLTQLAGHPNSNAKKNLENFHKAWDDQNIEELVIDPPPPAPPEPDPPKVSISLKLDAQLLPQQLADPNVQAILAAGGVQLPEQAPAEEAIPESLPHEGMPPESPSPQPTMPQTEETMATDIASEAVAI